MGSCEVFHAGGAYGLFLGALWRFLAALPHCCRALINKGLYPGSFASVWPEGPFSDPESRA